jgi:hypothetical protein
VEVVWCKSHSRNQILSLLNINMDITLFCTISKKYENIAAKSINQYYKLCDNKISKIFLVCEDSIDVLSLKIYPKFEYIFDSTAIKILRIDKPEFDCIVKDKWMLQQYFKLNCDILSKSENCIVTDVDGLLLKPINYFTEKKINLFYSTNSFKDRTRSTFKLVKRFFPNNKFDLYNFVTENSFFQHRYLTEARKFLGDFRQYRNAKHLIYDLSIEEYNSIAGSSFPKNPKLTTYQLFHDYSFNNVIFDELPKSVQDDIVKVTKNKVKFFNPNFQFSEYEFYSFFMLNFYPDNVNLVGMNIQVGFIPEKSPTFWLNEPTPAGREDTFLYIYNSTINEFKDGD